MSRRDVSRDPPGAFFSRVYEIVRQIPSGKAISYGQIARLLGAPGAARQVGWAMRRCPSDLPWQRVVRSDGSISGGLHADLRRALLEAEGAVFLPDGRVDMCACGWSGPLPTQPAAPERSPLQL